MEAVIHTIGAKPEFGPIQYLAMALLALVASYLVQAVYRQSKLQEREKEYWDQQRKLLDSKIKCMDAMASSEEGPWKGMRRFKVTNRTSECDDVCSFFLVPFDGKPLPRFLPGQHLTFELTDPGSNKSIRRCYSLSDKYTPNFYRVTIKKSPLQSPSASSYFHDHVFPGSVLNVMAPGGTFLIDEGRIADQRPLVFLAGGVGVTPLMSMLATISETGIAREVWFFFGVRNSKEHIMKRALQALARRHDWLNLVVCYSKPLEGDVLGKNAKDAGTDYNHKGHVNIDLVKSLLSVNNYSFYICGSPPMMDGLIKGLAEWGVPENHILYEAFGAPSVSEPSEGTGRKVAVKFAQTGKEVQCFSDRKLLEVAVANKAKIAWGCQAGSCGACETLVLSGNFDYEKKPGFTTTDANHCLPCVARPKTALVLDA